MMFLRHSGGWVILLSFIVAFLLDTVALPLWTGRLWPDWLILVLIYWCMALPHRVGIGTGWLFGLLLDVARGTLIGQHALGLALVAYFILRTYRRIRLFPVWQQSLSILFFILAEKLLIFWINGMTGYPPADGWFLLPVLSDVLLWPLIFIVLRDVRRYFHIV
jgi:rod shape-determining protein MreD